MIVIGNKVLDPFVGIFVIPSAASTLTLLIMWLIKSISSQVFLEWVGFLPIICFVMFIVTKPGHKIRGRTTDS